VLLTAVAATALHKWAEIILIPESQTQCYGAIFHTRESVCLGILKDKNVFKESAIQKKGVLEGSGCEGWKILLFNILHHSFDH